jgi:hypothetical protein
MAAAPLHHFLIVFDHDRGELLGAIQTFDDALTATEAYTATERRHSDDDRVEVVLLGSDSIETVRRTHPNYFSGGTSLSDRIDRYLENIS